MAALEITLPLPDLLPEITLNEIAAHMHWPGDADMRLRARKAMLAEFYRRHPEIRATRPEQAFAAAIDAEPLEFIQRAATGRVFAHGAVAGLTLRELIGRISAGDDRATLGECAAFAIDAFDRHHKRGKHRGGDRMTRNIFKEEVWPAYAPVAHMWAAWWESALISGDDALPCRAGEITNFLALAEAFRIAGENTRGWKSPKPILSPGASIGLPEGLWIRPARVEYEKKKLSEIFPPRQAGKYA